MQFTDYKVRIAIRKACSSSPNQPKAKHIRTIVLKSYSGGIPTFFSEITKTLQSPNLLQQYKAIDTLHRVMVEGSEYLFTGYLDMLVSLVNNLLANPPPIMKSVEYQHLNNHYLKYIQLRLVFNKKNRIFKMNLSLPPTDDLPEEYYSDQKCLGIISYIMDLMDYLLVLPTPLIEHYPGDCCKLDCCIPLILDSYVLFNDIMFFMNNLVHIDQHQSVFTFLYSRFKKMYKQLDDMYRLARQNRYISSLIDVPYLPPLPQFTVTEEEKKKYRKKHPQSFTSHQLQQEYQSQYPSQQQQHHHHHKKEKREKKEKKQRNEMMSLGKKIIQTGTTMIEKLLPDDINENDNGYRFVQMIKCLDNQMESMTTSQLENALWKTVLESTTLLDDTTLDHIVQSNLKEEITNVLFTLQGYTQDMKSLFTSTVINDDTLQEFNRRIEEFINAMMIYQKPIPNLLDLFTDDNAFHTPNEMQFEDYAFEHEDEDDQQNEHEYKEKWNEFRHLIDMNSDDDDQMKQVEERYHQETVSYSEEDDEEDDDDVDDDNKEERQENVVTEELQKLQNVKELLHQQKNYLQNPLMIQFEDITSQLTEFLQRADACEQERLHEGKQRSTNLYNHNEVWEEGLLSCAKKIVDWIEFISDCILNDIYDDQIIVALKQFKSLCCQLTSAAKVSMNEDSPSLHRLEDITKTLRTTIESFLSTIINKQQSKKKEQPQLPKKQNDIHSKKHLMESEIKVMQLQRELEDAQSELYSLRKQEYQ